MLSMTERKVATVYSKNPNPLFEKWLTEWKSDAQRKGSKMEKIFSYALSNLRKYKLTLYSGTECKILRGFGNTLCKLLDEKLMQHSDKKSNCDPSLKLRKQNQIEKLLSTDCIPQFMSGAYAILLALYNNCSDGVHVSSLTKCEIIHSSEYLSSACFLRTVKTDCPILWSSMKIVLKNGYVVKMKQPIRYSLTKKGYFLAKTMKEKYENTNGEKLLQLDNLESNSYINPVISNEVKDKSNLTNVVENLYHMNTNNSITENHPLNKSSFLDNSSDKKLYYNGFDFILYVDIQESVR